MMIQLHFVANFITPLIASVILIFFLFLLSPMLLLTGFFASLEISLITFVVLLIMLIILSFVLPKDETPTEE